MARGFATRTPQPNPTRLRGRVLVYRTKNGQTITKKWPRKRGPKKTDRQAKAVELFTNCQQWCKALPGEWVTQARSDMERRVWTYKDLLISCMYGRTVTGYARDGTVWQGARQMADYIQQLLDSVHSSVGSMLIRTSTGWGAVIPSTAGHVLTSRGPGVPPDFEVNPGAGGDNKQALIAPTGTLSFVNSVSMFNAMIWMPVFLQHGAEIATLYVYVVDKFGAYKLQGGIYSFDASNAGTLLQDTEIADDTPAGLTALTLGAPWTKVGNGLVWLGVNVREASLHMAGSTFSGYYGGGDYTTLPPSFTGLSWHGATYGIWIGIGQAGTF